MEIGRSLFLVLLIMTPFVCCDLAALFLVKNPDTALLLAGIGFSATLIILTMLVVTDIIVDRLTALHAQREGIDA